MYGLKDKDNNIVDVTSVTPTVSAEGVLFNDCFYHSALELGVVENIPEYVKPQRFKMEGLSFIPLIIPLTVHEIALIAKAIDDYTIELIEGGIL